MAQRVHRNPCAKVEELSVLGIPYPASTTVREHERRSGVNAKDVLLPECEGARSNRGFRGGRQIMSSLEVSSAGRRTMLKEENQQEIKAWPIVARTSDAAPEANRARTTALLANTLELITTGL